MTIRRLALFAALPLLAVAALLAVVAQGTGAQAEPVDLSGEWQLTVRGLASFDELPCGGTISQQETSVSLNLHCQFVEELALAGTVDQESGNFSLTGEIYGIDVVFFGEASGDSMHGSISHRDSWGTFTGTRIMPTRTPTPIGPLDLTGDWLLGLTNVQVGPQPAGPGSSCLVYLEQNAPDISGAVASCFDAGTTRITGKIDVDAETFSLSWIGSQSSFALSGSRSEGYPRVSGTFTGTVYQASITGSFGLGRTPNYWGTIVCFEQHIGPFPPPRPRVNGNAAALNALRTPARIHWSSVGCTQILDVNVDGKVDALDAALILQREAGLIPHLPIL